MKKRIAIFSSGSGINAQKLMEHFKTHRDAEVAIILTNKSDAYVIQRAFNFEIPSHITNKKEFYQTNQVVKILQNLTIDLIVLTDFTWLIPENLLKAFPNQIINIHLALLPKFGGKGMYSNHVHQKVLKDKGMEHGISIHFVTETFNEGEILYQASFELDKEETVQTLKFKSQQLEAISAPIIVENLIKKINPIRNEEIPFWASNYYV